jgi:hypothetical protein
MEASILWSIRCLRISCLVKVYPFSAHPFLLHNCSYFFSIACNSSHSFLSTVYLTFRSPFRHLSPPPRNMARCAFCACEHQPAPAAACGRRWVRPSSIQAAAAAHPLRCGPNQKGQAAGGTGSPQHPCSNWASTQYRIITCIRT